MYSYIEDLQCGTVGEKRKNAPLRRMGAVNLPKVFNKNSEEFMGVAALLKCLKLLKDEQLNVDVIGVISSQEKVGERGITAAMYRVKPDAAIFFEGCPADNTFSPAYMIQNALRGGVMLCFKYTVGGSLLTRPPYIAPQ